MSAFPLTEAQRSLQTRARDFARTIVAPRAATVDQSEQYPWETVRELAAAGFMGMTIPKAYGGPGYTLFDTCLVIEEMARVCGVTARIVVEGNMGALGAILRYGSEDQKRQVAGLVLQGDKPAICITEPGAGSAATEMTTTALRDGDGWILNGTKHWITGGGVSRTHLIFARVIEQGEDKGIAGFLAVRNPDALTPEGLIIAEREPTMGLRGIPETVVHFENLRLPADALIAPPEGVASGFKRLMSAYNAQRLGAATVALGLAQGAFDQALGYVQEREQFGRPLAEFQGLQWMLADMSTEVEAARALIHATAAAAPGGLPNVRLAANAKIFAAEMAVRVTNNALQMHGARGYSRNCPVERMVRDARMFTIGGGTAQVLRNVVASKLLDRKLPQTRDGYLPQPAEMPAESVLFAPPLAAE